jgi:hypothetical protein
MFRFKKIRTTGGWNHQLQDKLLDAVGIQERRHAVAVNLCSWFARKLKGVEGMVLL